MRYLEPRFSASMEPIPGVPVVPDGGPQRFSAQNCGNLPTCYACRKQIARHENYLSVPMRYVSKQPTGDIVLDYVHGGTDRAAYGTFHEECFNANQ